LGRYTRKYAACTDTDEETGRRQRGWHHSKKEKWLTGVAPERHDAFG